MPNGLPLGRAHPPSQRSIHVITPTMDSNTSSAPRASAHPVLWLMAFAAILYLSLYPFADWGLRRPSPWAWLSIPLMWKS